MAENVHSVCGTVDANEVAELLLTPMHKRVILDCRCFLDFNVNHIVDSVNVACSKLLKRRLQSEKKSISEYLAHNFRIEVDEEFELIVYDLSTQNLHELPSDSCLAILLLKLAKICKSVSLLIGGFSEFESMHPGLCVNKRQTSAEMGDEGFPPRPMHHHSVSQPCLPVANLGPTKVLPFLFLGSQLDALCLETMTKNGITYVLNVSTLGQKPDFIQDGHFLRIPVNDNYSDKLLPFFQDAFQFLDKVREANGCVLVHCLAGISRSPTVVIAYIMHTLKMNMDEAYRYIKDKRPAISPNFNFLGQLLEYEKQQTKKTDEASEQPFKTFSNGLLVSATDAGNSCRSSLSAMTSGWTSLGSPTTVLARLTFGQLSPLSEQPSPPVELRQKPDMPFPLIPSLGGERFSVGSLSPKPSVATKRPLSSHELHSSKQTEDHSNTNAKRPLVRPSSIAFMPLPAMPLPTNDIVRSPASHHLVQGRNTEEKPEMENLSPSSLDVSPSDSDMNLTLTGLSGSSSSCLSEISTSTETSLIRPWRTTIDRRGYEMSKWKKRKSRSLEDVLGITYNITNPDEDTGNTSPSTTSKNYYLLNVLTSPSSLGLDKRFLDSKRFLNCHSITSDALPSLLSGDSQHDSLEMISVS